MLFELLMKIHWSQFSRRVNREYPTFVQLAPVDNGCCEARSTNRIRTEISYEYRVKIKIEKSNDNFDGLKWIIKNKSIELPNCSTCPHNYLAMDNGDQMSEIVFKFISFIYRETSIRTSIHRSQIEQCEHRGGRNILQVRQYFRYVVPKNVSFHFLFLRRKIEWKQTIFYSNSSSWWIVIIIEIIFFSIRYSFAFRWTRIITDICWFLFPWLLVDSLNFKWKANHRLIFVVNP